MADARYFRIDAKGDELILQVGGERFAGWLWRRGNNGDLISVRKAQEVVIERRQFGKVTIRLKGDS